MRKLLKINLLAASLLSVTSFAADLTTSKINVISTTPLPGIGVSLDKIPSNVQVVKGSDIQKSQSLDLSNYMNQNLIGVNVNEMQGNPLQADISYRGFTASPLLGTPQGLSVYMDGVRMNQPFGDVVSWDLIPKNAIYGMQLMPGSNPLFGLNTLGGAISVQTKDGRNSPGGAIQETLGSYGRNISEFEYGGVSKDNSVDYFIAGTYFDENGWRKQSESDNKQLFTKLGWQGEKTDLKLTYAYSKSDLNGNGVSPSSLLALNRANVYTYPDNTKNESHFLNLTGSHDLGNEKILSGNAYYRHLKSKTYNADINDDALPETPGTIGQTMSSTYSEARRDENDVAFTQATTALKKAAYNAMTLAQRNVSDTNATNRALVKYRAAYGDGLYKFSENKTLCVSNAASPGDEPGEKCSGIINRTSNKQNNLGVQLQLSANNKLFDKNNTYTVGGGADFSKSHFSQSAEYGYLDSALAGATVIGIGKYADEVTRGVIDGALDDRSAVLKSKTRTWSAFATDTLSLTDTLHLSASGRYNYTKIENRDQQIHHTSFDPAANNGAGAWIFDATANNQLASLSGDHIYARFNPAVGLNFSPNKAFTSYAGYNEGSRAATSIELGCANPDFPCRLPNAMAGDPHLKQVVAKTFEAGFRGNANDFSYSVGVFNTRNINDILFVASTATGNGFFKNFGETQRRGVETSLGTQLGAFSLGGNYTYLDATYESRETINGAANSSADGDGNIQINPGNHMTLAPKNNLKLFFNYRFNDKFNIGLDSITRSSSYLRGNENNQHQAGGNFRDGGKSAGYTVFNLTASFKPKSDWTFFGRVNNLFDRDYSSGGVLGINPYNTSGQLALGESTSCSTSNTSSTALNCNAVGKMQGSSEAFLAPGSPRTAWIGIRWEFGGAKKSSETTE